jgi:hypothetical protein
MTIKPGTLLKASIILLTVFASCKETETIKRDIIITPAPVEFTIPIIINTNSGQVAGDMLDTVNIEAEMRKATVEFGVDNIRDLRITAFKLELLDIPLANENNLGNFEAIQVEINNDGSKAKLAGVTDNSSAKSGSIMIPGGVSTPELKEILNASSFKYDIRVKLRKPTTVALKARVTPSYTITVGF